MPDIAFFRKPIAALTADDLHDLVITHRVREHLQLDYKAAYDLGNRENTIEMLADITAMANAAGGRILIGVTEDPDADDGTPLALDGIPNGDQETNRIQSICESSIDEKIVGLQIRDIPLPNGQSCVIIDIPNSLRKPHMINHKKHHSVRIRNGRSKRFLDMPEIRTMILDMDNVNLKLADFLTQRRAHLARDADGRSALALMATPIYVNREKLDPIGDPAFGTILHNPPERIDPKFEGLAERIPAQPRIFGLESTLASSNGQGRNVDIALRLFRNGHFEYFEKLDWYLAGGTPSTQNESPQVRAYQITVDLAGFLATMRQITSYAEIREPIAVTLRLEHIRHATLKIATEWWGRTDPYIWPDDTVEIGLTTPDLTDTLAITRQLMDRLFNAFAIERCPYFTDTGEFTIQRR